MTEHLAADALFPISRFSRYRELAAAKGYCDPFVPTVGRLYGQGLLPRIVYCGVAARWGDEGQEPEVNDVELLRSSAIWSAQAFEHGAFRSAFWRMLDAILLSLDADPLRDPATRRQCGAWTNLSKSGLGRGATCPPDNDADLRALDVAQLTHEIDLLNPDLLVCVSGNNLVSTGVAVFRNEPEWMPGSDVVPKTPQTEIRRMPNGGWLLWTMHPQFKSEAWSQGLLEDVSRLSERL